MCKHLHLFLLVKKGTQVWNFAVILFIVAFIDENTAGFAAILSCAAESNLEQILKGKPLYYPLRYFNNI